MLMYLMELEFFLFWVFFVLFLFWGGVLFGFFGLFQNLCSFHLAYMKLKCKLSEYYGPGTVLSALYIFI